MSEKQYSVTTIDLTTAGEQEIQQEGDYFCFVTALDGAGAQQLSATIEVAVGRSIDDYVPMTINNIIRGYASRYRIKWSAQAGIKAYLYVARGPEPLEITSPPARQLVTSAIAAGFTHNTVSVGVAATLIVAASGTRQSLILQNLGAADVYIGGSAVTTANGLKLASGASLTIDGTTAAVYGISGTAGQDVRYLQEA